MIYTKALRLSSAARRKFTIGEITNFMSVDAERFLSNFVMVSELWSSPLCLALAMVMLYNELGVASFVGVAVLLVVTPLNVWGSKKGQDFETKHMEFRDRRMKDMNELLNGIKVLKMYAWEKPFVDKIMAVRTGEISLLQKAFKLYCVVFTFSFGCVSFMVAVGVFACYAWLHPNEPLDAQKIFVSITLFNLVRLSLIMLPCAIVDTIKLVVSVKRISDFLNADETHPEAVGKNTQDVDNAIEFRNASFSWTSGSEDVHLQRVDVDIKKGSLVAVVGVVGSGKSSLLSALLGDMEVVEGHVNAAGSVAYVPQQAWIQNMSLKDNVLFDSRYDVQKYEQAIDACALTDDLKILAAGDSTEIGENGINLSGGQKQRVSLARAVYSNADVYLLDDPLSAVDAHVGKHLFSRVLDSRTGVLRNKTRVLVTHNVQILKKVDYILVMKEGRVSEQGTYNQLMEAQGHFAGFLLEYMMHQEEADTSNGDSQSPSKRTKTVSESHSVAAASERRKSRDNPLAENGFNAAGNAEGGRLVAEEEAQTDKVDWNVYLNYVKQIGLGKTVAILLLFGISRALQAASDVWLASWADLSETNKTAALAETPLYLGVYAGLGAACGVLELAKQLLLFLGCLFAAKLIHDDLLFRVIRSPMSFFDTTPNGRILNRFSADIDTVDSSIPNEVSDFLICLMESLSVLIVICYVTPWFVAVVVPLAVVFVLVQKYYIRTSRQLKRLDSIYRSPIFSHFTEGVSGAQSVRAYGHQDRFVKENMQRVDRSVGIGYLNIASNRWLGTRIDNLGNIVILFASLFAIWSRDSMSTGLAGLSISYAITVIDALNWMVRMLCQLETDFVALERILEYTNNDQEDSWNKDADDALQDWPSSGVLQFRNYQTRYRAGLDLALKGIDMHVQPGEKIGICGRTGAGKTSLTLALFRIIEASAGDILIDGQNIAHLGLHKLRSQLTIIPQDPVLFGGTLRFNLDPLNQYSDNELWAALELAHLKHHVREEGLDQAIDEGGENFSVGQRQLICLARAVLRKTKFLILDEATAAVDLETDKLVQETIRKEFEDCTILTIAHRINTILNYDKIAVFSDGRLVEFDAPEKLMATRSLFRDFAQSAGK